MSITQKQWAHFADRIADLSAGAIRTLAALEAVTCRATGWASITVAGLMARADQSRASIFRHLAELVRRGLLHVTPQWSSSGQRSNRYRIVDHTPEQAQEAERARKERRQAVYRAATVRRQECLLSWSRKLEAYVWSRVQAAMMGLKIETPLPISGSQDEAVFALKGINMTLWQQRSRPQRIFRLE